MERFRTRVRDASAGRSISRRENTLFTVRSAGGISRSVAVALPHPGPKAFRHHVGVESLRVMISAPGGRSRTVHNLTHPN